MYNAQSCSLGIYDQGKGYQWQTCLSFRNNGIGKKRDCQTDQQTYWKARPSMAKKSFDTTIRDDKHLYHAIKYTLNNPISAGYVEDRKDWPGFDLGSGAF